MEVGARHDGLYYPLATDITEARCGVGDSVEVSNGPCRANTIRFLAGHACQRVGSCRPSEGFGPCRASPRKKIGGPGRPISPWIIRAMPCRVVPC